MTQPLNFRQPGITPRIGDLLNSRRLYELRDEQGWSIKVDANDPQQASELAVAAGFSATGIRTISEE